MPRRWLLALLLCTGCPARSAAPTTPATAPAVARPSVDECKAASDRVVEITLSAFDDDPVFVAEIMGEVRDRPPEDRDVRCHDAATMEQVACLASLTDVAGIAGCAPQVVSCLRSQDAGACAAMKAEWGWGVELLTSALNG